MENKIVLGFAISLFALLFLGWLSFETTNQLVATEDWVNHTHDVMASLETGRAVIAEAESCQRGCLLTGDPEFLKQSQRAQAQVAGWLAKVRRLIADNPQQQQRLASLTPAISNRLEVLNRRIELRQQQGLQAAVDAVALRQGENLMNQVQAGLAGMLDAEKQLLWERQHVVQASARSSEIVLVSGSVLACAIALLSLWRIRRDLHLRRQAEAGLQESSRQLQTVNEQLQLANQELESFSYSVSHDLRAPLRHIDGFVGLLERELAGKLGPQERRHLDIIAAAARQMGALIDDLLVFSRMGRTELQQARVAMTSLVQEAVAALQTETKGRAITWKIAALPEIKADPAMIRQVWINLIANAVKYTRPRQPAEIEIGCTDHRNGKQVFFIRDNGVGFDMRYADKLFKVFQRLHRADEFEGTGIGLANVSRIVQRHGGRIWAEAKTNVGATFFFSLPTHAQPQPN